MRHHAGKLYSTHYTNKPMDNLVKLRVFKGTHRDNPPQNEI